MDVICAFFMENDFLGMVKKIKYFSYLNPPLIE